LRVQANNSPGSFEVTTDSTGVVGHAGAALLRELADRLGLTRALGWRVPGGRRRHPDAAVLRDLAVLLADGGDCLSDLAALRDQPELFGPVASTPTAWRVIQRLAQDPDGLARLRAARAHARARAWAAGAHPDLELLVIDADATLVLAHSDAKQGAAGTYKGSFGFAPLLAYLDRGQAPGEPLAGILRPGNAAPGATDDLVELVDLALAQLPRSATDQPILVRSDSAAASTRLARHLREQGVGFSLGMPIDAHVREAILAQPERAWIPAVDPDGQPRKGAEVCELTGWIDLHTWPEGTRAICRREDAHPGAQLRFTDHNGHRFQVFLTDQPDPDLAYLELRHASAPASRTASAPPRPPAFATSPSTCGAATPSGWSWSWPPKTCCTGPRRCCWTATSPWPSPRPCATGCCTSPPGSFATPAARSCGCSAPGHGPLPWRAHSPACARSRCAADNPITRNHPRPTRADPGCPGSAAGAPSPLPSPSRPPSARPRGPSGRHTGIPGAYLTLPGPHTAITAAS
jgi:hypothetical protein